MFIFRMSSHTVITVVIVIATFTGVTNGIHEEPEQGIYSNKEPFQDQVSLQKSYYDETQPFLLPFSTIVQRTTRNMKDIENVEHPPMTLRTMDFDHFLQLLPLLKAVNKITPVKPTEIHARIIDTKIKEATWILKNIQIFLFPPWPDGGRTWIENK